MDEPNPITGAGDPQANAPFLSQRAARKLLVIVAEFLTLLLVIAALVLAAGAAGR